MENWKNSSVWVLNQENQWVTGKVIECQYINEHSSNLTIEIPDEKPILLTLDQNSSNNGESNHRLKKRDELSDSQPLISDMTSLRFLNEPEMLSCIRRRYSNNLIYTAVGPILIVINPCQPLPIYGPNLALKYFKASISGSRELGPHVYQLADTAYRRMIIDKYNPDNRENQVILVNGESGAGKTEATKQVLEYLSLISSEILNEMSLTNIDSTNIQQLVMSVNPITESFGNAKTIRNNNSSRFGKMIDLFYSSDGYIEGVHISTYLLETIRVTYQLPNERNYRIFYELFYGLTEEKKKLWNYESLLNFTFINSTSSLPMMNTYTNNNINTTINTNTNTDFLNYQLLMTALHQINFTDEEIEHICRAVIGILHLGNINFISIHDHDGVESVEYSSSSQQAIDFSCQLLGLNSNLLHTALTRRQYLISNKQMTTVDKYLTMSSAVTARNALARTLYEVLFTRIIDRINITLNSEDTSSATDNDDHASSISLLDVFGFEYYEHNNSYEQFCINYINEKLQDYFNYSIFKSQHELYLLEGISWNITSYPDSTERIDLFENKTTGLFLIFDEILKITQPNPKKLIQIIYSKNEKKNVYFHGSKILENSFQFVIRHYACEVRYGIEGWIEKNKNDLSLEIKNCILESKNLILKSANYREGGDGEGGGGGGEMGEKEGGATHLLRDTSPIKISQLMPIEGLGSPSPVRRKSLTITSKIKINSFEQRSLSLAMDSNTPTQQQQPSQPSQPSQSSQPSQQQPLTQFKSFITVGKKINTNISQLSKEFNELMKKIHTMRSHFIRCIKPNGTLTPGIFLSEMILLQLRCGGTLQAIQVYQDGFPQRMNFQYFLSHYSVLLCLCGMNYVTNEVIECINKAQLTGQMLYWRLGAMKLIDVIRFAMKMIELLEDTKVINQGTAVITDLELQQGLQIGKTSVFLRTNIFECLENLYTYCVTMIAKKLQRRWRAYKYIQSSSSSSLSQGLGRGHSHALGSSLSLSLLSFSDYKLKKLKRELFAVVVIQRRFRLHSVMRTKKTTLSGIRLIQALYRGYRTRKWIFEMKSTAACCIQSLFRKYYQRKRYLQILSASMILQRNIRIFNGTIWKRRALSGISLIQRLERGRQARSRYKLLYTQQIRKKYEERCQQMSLLERKLKENPSLLEDINRSEEIITTLRLENQQFSSDLQDYQLKFEKMSMTLNEHQQERSQTNELNSFILTTLESFEKKYEEHLLPPSSPFSSSPSPSPSSSASSSIQSNDISKKLLGVIKLIDTFHSQIIALEKEIINLKEEKISQQTLFMTKEMEFESTQQAAEEKKRSLHYELENITQQNSSLQFELQNKSLEISSLTNQLEELKREMEQVTQGNQQLQESCKEKRSQLEELQQSESHLKSQLDETNNQLKKLQERVLEAEERVNSNELKHMKLLNDEKKRVCEVEEERGKLVTQLQQQEVTIQDLKEKNKIVIQENEDLKRDSSVQMESLEMRIKEMRGMNEELERSYEKKRLTFDQQNENWMREREEFEERMREVKRANEEKERQSHQLQEERNDLLGRNSTLERLVDEKIEMIQLLESQLENSQTENGILQEKIQKTEKSLEDLNVKFNKYEVSYLTLQSNTSLQLTTKQHEITQLTQTLTELELKYEQKMQSLQDFQQTNLELSKEFQQKKTENEKLQQNYLKLEQNFQEEFQKFNNKVSTLEKQIQSLENNCHDKEINLTSLQKKFQDLEKKYETEKIEFEFQIKSTKNSLLRLEEMNNEMKTNYLNLSLKNDEIIEEINKKNQELNEVREEQQNLKSFYDELLQENEENEVKLRKKIEKLELKCQQLNRNSLRSEYQILQDRYSSLQKKYEQLQQHFQHRKNIDLLSNLKFKNERCVDSMRGEENSFDNLLLMHGVVNKEEFYEQFERKWRPPLRFHLEGMVSLTGTLSVLIMSLHICDQTRHERNWNVIPCVGDFEEYHWILESNSTLITREFPVINFLLISSIHENISSSLQVKIQSINLLLEQLPANERHPHIRQYIQEIQHVHSSHS